jgi:hypothetical protein
VLPGRSCFARRLFRGTSERRPPSEQWQPDRDARLPLAPMNYSGPLNGAQRFGPCDAPSLSIVSA